MNNENLCFYNEMKSTHLMHACRVVHRCGGLGRKTVCVARRLGNHMPQCVSLQQTNKLFFRNREQQAQLRLNIQLKQHIVNTSNGDYGGRRPTKPLKYYK